MLTRARQKVQTEEGLFTQLNLEKHNHLCSEDAHGTSLVLIQQQAAYLEGLDHRIQNQRNQLDLARSIFSGQRDRVIEAATRRKTLEQLKDKHRAEHRAVLSRNEQKVLDEVGIIAYTRKAVQ